MLLAFKYISTLAIVLMFSMSKEGADEHFSRGLFWEKQLDQPFPKPQVIITGPQSVVLSTLAYPGGQLG